MEAGPSRPDDDGSNIDLRGHLSFEARPSGTSISQSDVILCAAEYPSDPTGEN
jgi:hypothetical protein